MTAWSLQELNLFIKQVLQLNFQEPFWLKCEIAQVKLAKGHYYIDLVQKAEDSDEVIAQGNAVLWSNKYHKLLRKFGLELKQLLQEGLEVLILANISFHERYGLKIEIEDFDTAYSLGKLELKRRATIHTLKQLNLLDKNSQIDLPIVIQNIAVISSETAAGYQDFIKQLSGNSFGFKYFSRLFQASMQGNQAEPEIIEALSQIENQKERFDIIVVIRGGGAKLDLVAFDNYKLCMAAANASLPLFTGIGHDVDETVLDIVAHTALKTPTAVAEFIIQHNAAFEGLLTSMGSVVGQLSMAQLNREERNLRVIDNHLNLQSRGILKRQEERLQFHAEAMRAGLRSIFSKEALKISSVEKNVRLLGPETAFKRGFSITTSAGKIITDARQLEVGAEICSQFLNSSAVSTVQKIKNEQ